MRILGILLTFTAAALAADTWRDASPHKSGVVQANGIRLHYLDWGGSGEAMVFLAGLGNTAHVFDALAPKFAGKFRVVGMTRRGFGQSDRPDTGYNMAGRLADLTAFLDAMKIQKAILVGHSLAGDELTAFAAAYPQRVIKLVYLDAAYDRSTLPAEPLEKLELAVSAVVLERIPKLADEATPLEREIAYTQARFGKLWNDVLETEVRDNYVAGADGTLKRRPFPPIQALIAGSRNAKLDYSKLKSPSLSFFAQSDLLEEIPAEKRAELAGEARTFSAYFDGQIATLKKNAQVRVVVLAKAHHYCWFDRGDEVVGEMNAFLEGPAEAAIRRTMENLIAADNARDLDRVVAQYTSDAVLLPPGLTPIAGAAAIRERYRGLYANSVPSLNHSLEEIVVREDWAFVRGRVFGMFPSRPNQPARQIDDKFVMMLKREGGDWRIARLIWNASKAD